MDAIGAIDLLISCAWLAAVCWLLVHAIGQSRHFKRIAAASTTPGGAADQVVIIVPARNEACNIRRCVESLLAQAYPRAFLQVLVVNDHSTDDTAAIVRSIAAREPALVLLDAPPLPPGWVGKSHACWIGTRSVAVDTEWLCFLDADVWAEPGLIASAVECAMRDQIDLLSLAPRHELESFAERLMLPCGHYLLAFCQDLRKQQDQTDCSVSATGQFMLVRRRIYAAVGGHAAVAAAICEDVALARLVRRAGGKVVYLAGDHLLSTRMYTGWRTLWPGIAKNLVEMLGGARSTILIAASALMLSWAAIAIPAFDALNCAHGTQGACAALVPALIGSGMAFGLHLAGTFHFGIPIWYGLLFPLGYTAGAAMAIDSIRRRLRGRVSWKGRIYS